MTTDTLSAATEDEAIDQQEDAGGSGTKAPYMSFKGLENLFAKFHAEGLPARFDASYFNQASGSLISQVRNTLSYFDLIDAARVPTSTLSQLAEKDESGRKQILKGLFEAKYADALILGRNATTGQLTEVFRNRGLSGATVTKAMSFYLAMARYVGADLSPHFKVGRAPAGGTGGAKRRRAGAASGKTPVPPLIEPTPPAPPEKRPATSIEEQKAAYVKMLMDLATKQEGGSDAGQLLDRIERALGIGEPASPAPRTSPPAEVGD